MSEVQVYQKSHDSIVVIHTAFLCSDFPIWHSLFSAAAPLTFQDPVSFLLCSFPFEVPHQIRGDKWVWRQCCTG